MAERALADWKAYGPEPLDQERERITSGESN